MPRLTGAMMIRPARVAMAFEPDLDRLRRAVQKLTGTWGGVFSPLLDASMVDESLRWAHALSIDAIVALDDSEGATTLASTPGFEWQGRGVWSPYLDQPCGPLRRRLLGPDWMLVDAPPPPLLNLHWVPTDPLDTLFRVWFGEIGDGEHNATLRDLFDKAASQLLLDEERPLEDVTAVVSPINFTGHDIENNSEVGRPAFVVIDLTSARDLMMFWNLRASGREVFPWPRQEDLRLRSAALHWMRRIDTRFLSDDHGSMRMAYAMRVQDAVARGGGNVYHGPVVISSGDGAQIAFNNENVTQNQMITKQVTPGFELIAEAVAETLRRLPEVGLEDDEHKATEEAAHKVLAEVTKPEPNRSVVKSGVALIKGFLLGVATGTTTGAAEGAQELAKTAIKQLGSAAF